MYRRRTLGVKIVILAVGAVALAVNIFLAADAQWWQWIDWSRVTEEVGRARVSDELMVTQSSIMLVEVRNCEGSGGNTGTGFVIADGYVATAAHVVDSGKGCSGGVKIRDLDQLSYDATVVGFDAGADLAILAIPNLSLPSLKLGDSASLEDPSELVSLITIGYPLLGAVADAGKPTVSSEGQIARYDATRQLFVTSGLNLNPGNSGGPVFLKDPWLVIGVASAILDPDKGEEVGWVVPIDLLKALFLNSIGEELREL